MATISYKDIVKERIIKCHDMINLIDPDPNNDDPDEFCMYDSVMINAAKEALINETVTSICEIASTHFIY